jgi:hypothetical protein
MIVGWKDDLRALVVALPREDLTDLIGELGRAHAVALQRMLAPSSDREKARVGLTTDELADVFQVHPCTILDWLHRGHFGAEGAGWYKLGRRYYVRRSALEHTAMNSPDRREKPFRLPRQPAR